MRAAGFSPLAIGSALLLGASVGGELLNPGAPELLTISDRTKVPTTEMQSAILPLVLSVLITSTLVFWLMTIRGELREVLSTPSVLYGGKEEPDHKPINPFKAMVPVVPLALLFLSGPPLYLFDVPQGWLITVGKDRSDLAASRLIALAMLLGVAVAAIAAPRQANGCMRAFFEGAGYGFTHIVSLIVTANCFGTGIELVGLARELGQLIVANPGLLHPLAGAVPALFAFVCGSGMASTQSLYGFFHDASVGLGNDPKDLRVGAMVSTGSAVGRTMSPVAAVTLMSATLTGAKPFELVRRVGPPLLAGLATAILLRVLGVV
jgi:DcuC family C4-dicarboxylate transporter